MSSAGRDSKIEEKVEWIERDSHHYYTRRFKPTLGEGAKPTATLLMLHGYGDQCDRYERLARKFASAGIEVLTYDQLGWGRTGVKNNCKGDSGGWQRVLDDVGYMSNLVCQEGVPHFLYGHSMGGMIALSYAAKRGGDKPRLTGVISSAPGLLVSKESRPPHAVIWVLNAVAKFFRWIPWAAQFLDSHLTQDMDEIKFLKESQFCYTKSNLGTLHDILYHGEECCKDLCKRFEIPVLLVHGDGDKITDPDGTRIFYEGLPKGTDRQMHILECPYHEIHFEPGFRESLPAMFIKWIYERAN
ncbi:hypothetical protein EV182_004224 [Spiromyces aspiralis]|uniref:Uncharacterized protein n=1 Tax=Spiromyces aspiralis TaxID=68401 RepID=A0ACC1HE23_9FUNG|nr:hypothetical protein EV182_004224 [Spiromyces aspiralis]